MKYRAIIGLGNPGSKYYNTRHNIGFRVADFLVERYSGSWSEKSDMSYSQIMIPGEDITSLHVIKPLTFMNTSGKVIPFLIKKGIAAEEILVIHDELEKPFGKMMVKQGGSARGHNGLRSIISVIGPDFWRLRFGIGRPEEKADVGNYVLSRFTQEEESCLPELIESAVDLLERP